MRAEKVIDASDKLRPVWISKPLERSRDSYCFIPIVCYTSSPESGFVEGLSKLIQSLPRDWKIRDYLSLENITDAHRDNGNLVSHKNAETLVTRVDAEGGPVDLRCRVVDSYWEKVVTVGGVSYKHYILYQVLSPYAFDEFQSTSVTTSYGARAGFMSLVPGAGQFYKGSKVKGVVLFGSCALAAGGIVFCGNQSGYYRQKITMTHDVKLIKSYNAKANHYAMARNICAGVAGAVYVYNLVDAFVAPGARRVVIGKKEMRFSMAPSLLGDGFVGLAFNMKF